MLSYLTAPESAGPLSNHWPTCLQRGSASDSASTAWEISQSPYWR